MGKFQFNGEVAIVFPTLGLTVSPGDVFEAPDGFVADNVVSSRAKVTITSDADLDTDSVTSDAPVDAPSSDEPTDTPIDASDASTDAPAETPTN